MMATPVGEPAALSFLDDSDTRHWRDDGCDLHDHCLTCPFARCKYDLPTEETRARGTRMASRTRRIHELRAQGIKVEVIAVLVGVSLRTVYRSCAQEGGTQSRDSR